MGRGLARRDARRTRGGVIRVCFHGAESTGKSVLAEKLHREFGIPWVPEYGRDYAERNGTQFTMDDLLAIAAGQDAAMRSAAADQPALLILDTDPLMTAAWAQMLFGTAPSVLLTYAKAERYLLFEPDVAWVGDGTRMFGSAKARGRFAQIAEAVLLQAGLSYQRIGGDWAQRERTVRQLLQLPDG